MRTVRKVLCMGVILGGMTALSLRGAPAQVSFVSAPAGLRIDATFDWTTLNTTNPTPVPDPSALTAGPLGFTLTNFLGSMEVTTNPAFTLTAGGTEDILVGNLNFDPAQPPFRFDFSTGIEGFGAYMEWGGFEQANYTITAFGAGNLPLFTQSVPSPGVQGDPEFLGVVSTSANIYAIELSGSGVGGAAHTQAISDPLFQLAAATPEPGSWAFGFAGVVSVGGLVVRRRRDRC